MYTGFNDDLAVYTQKYPHRYSGLAALTTADIDGLLQSFSGRTSNTDL